MQICENVFVLCTYIHIAMRFLPGCSISIDHLFFLADVAISAPFGDQPGTVYIYVGANDDNNVLLQQTPVQVSVCVYFSICFYFSCMCSCSSV